MKRNCLIIGAPGSDTKGNYLEGVNRDIDTFQTFLQSAGGGAWNSSEIDIIINPRRSLLRSRLTSRNAYDFTITFFSGHGGICNHDNSTYLALNNLEEEIDVNELVNGSDRQLIIVDSCRSYYKRAATLAGDAMMKAESYTRDSRLLARALYDSHLEASEHGCIVAYAASEGEAANDTTEGGAFTQALLRSGSEFSRGGNQQGILGFNMAFTAAKNEVSQKYRSQNPCIVGSTRRRYWFPFAVKIPQGNQIEASGRYSRYF